jgi:transposase
VAVSALWEHATILELASKHDVHATVIHRWKCQVLASMEAGFSEKLEKSHAAHEAHTHEIHAKIGQLSVEWDFSDIDAKKILKGTCK